MKKIGLLSLLALFLFSCGNNKTDTITDKDFALSKIEFDVSFLNNISSMDVAHYYYKSENAEFPNYKAEIKKFDYVNQIISAFRSCSYYAAKVGAKGLRNFLCLETTFYGNEDNTFVLYTESLPGYTKINTKNIAFNENNEIIYKDVYYWNFRGTVINFKSGYEKFLDFEYEYFAVFNSKQQYQLFIDAVSKNSYEE